RLDESRPLVPVGEHAPPRELRWQLLQFRGAPRQSESPASALRTAALRSWRLGPALQGLARSRDFRSRRVWRRDAFHARAHGLHDEAGAKGGAALELQIPVVLTAVLLAAFVPQQIAGMPRKCKGKLGRDRSAEQNGP